jgi:hypothetical protein
MKAIYSLLFLLLIIGCNSNENKYVIAGSFKEKQVENWIYLINPKINTGDVDSAKVINGRFEFRGLVEVSEICYLSYHPVISEDAFGFFLEPSELDVIIDPSDWIDGSTIKVLD